MTYVSPDTAYMKHFAPFLEKKFKLAIDAWGCDETHVRQFYEPFTKFIADNVEPKYRELYPFPVWKFENRIERLARNVLLAEYLVQEWADYFKGLSEEEIDGLARSFAFENCKQREGLNKVLVAHKDLRN
jgi:hypothetical protein